MRGKADIKWNVTATENGFCLEPVYLPNLARPLDTEQHFIQVHFFSTLIIVAYLSVFFYFNPAILIALCPWYIGALFSVYAALLVFALVGFPVTWLIDRFIRVLYCRPDDEKVPWTWVTRTGYSLKSVHGFVILFFLCMIPPLAACIENQKRYQVVDGKVPGLEFTKSHGHRQHTLNYMLAMEEPDPAWAPSLFNIIENEKEEYNKGLAIKILAKLYGAESLEMTILKLQNRSCRPMVEGDETLRQYARMCNSSRLMKTIMDECTEMTRQKFARVLIERGDEKAFTAVLNMLEKDGSKDVRRRVVELLGNSSDVRAITPLIKVMNSDEYPWVRCFAAQALGRIGQEKRVIDALLNAWEFSEMKNVPHYASDALRSILPREDFTGWCRCNADGSCESYHPMRDPQTARAIYEEKKDRYVWVVGEKRFRIHPDAICEAESK